MQTVVVALLLAGMCGGGQVGKDLEVVEEWPSRPWNKPFVLRAPSKAASARRLHLDALVNQAAHAQVQVGSAHTIVQAGGQGPEARSLHQYIEQMQSAACQGAGQGSRSRACTDYLFDRGDFFRKFPDLLDQAAMPNVWTLEDWEAQARAAHAGPHLLGSTSQLARVNTYLLLGPRNTGVHFHFHTDSLLKIHAGRKLPNTSQYATVDAWWRDVAQPKDVPGLLSQLLLPGDLAFIPAWWRHATLNRGSYTLATASQPHLALQQPLALMNAIGQLLAAKDLPLALELLEQLAAVRKDIPLVNEYDAVALVVQAKAALLHADPAPGIPAWARDMQQWRYSFGTGLNLWCRCAVGGAAMHWPWPANCITGLARPTTDARLVGS
ncbi:uncharacterized protein MONBRDRAFT_7036 [Monosiga brevicollis MX1]|uniref:JmjC domain-containing protein n=1 Tax=Monosiga brevicollis TaxID=81824 RepID=A9UVQ2_MONBE|nr:uncharacterized protein MONBRDRAFT_7036 [Monosiga brevicollis MX1]EDQ90625.1 predicted protein [Monosiga brevicollis MX1]|eukprot:XP_001744676.1 hypothetical protein [Monosiga brevicollis MX1]